LSGGDWILTPRHSISRHRGGGEEENKRKKKKEEQQGCRLWDYIWDEICRFFIFFLFFFPEFVYGQQGCRLWGSILDGICRFFFFIIIFPEFVYGWDVACGALFGVGFVPFYLFIIIFS
jgi:hypothetical protein